MKCSSLIPHPSSLIPFFVIPGRTPIMATAAAPVTTAGPSDDSLGLDRPFLMMLARLPLIAAGFVLAAWVGHQISPLAPTVLLCLGMIVAAVIDGWAFKVPNWL